MKKLVASVGLVAISATVLKAQPGLSRMEASKPWSISASLRGFYDDNYTTAHSSLDPDGSFGIEVSPSISLNIPLEATFIGLSYTYSMQYFEDRSDDAIDHQHEFEATLDHRFNERYSIRLEESFVYSQEPEVIDNNFSFPLRTESETLRNRFKARFRGDITETFGLEAGFQNTFYNYSDDGVGSRSALLDRVENLFNLDGRYIMQPDLTGILGYQFGTVRYTGDDPISVTNPNEADIRDNNSHYFYLGAEHQISRQFLGRLKVGAQYTDYDNVDESNWSPYVEAGGTYTYLPGSFVQFGLKHTRNATDVVGTAVGSDVTLDQESTILYGSVSHRITPHLTGNLLGQLQHATFNGGEADGDVDNYFALGANLEYRINQYWSTEAGYNYDRLDSDQPLRSFSRNRVYVGVRATF